MKAIPFSIPKSGEEAFRVQTDRQPYLYDKLHRHPEIQLTLIIEGAGTLIAGDYVGRFEAGDLFVIGASLPHVFRNDERYYQQEPGLHAHALSIFFDESTLGRDFWRLPETKTAGTFIHQCRGAYQLTDTKKKETEEKILALQQAKGIRKLLIFIEIITLLSNRNTCRLLTGNELTGFVRSSDNERLNKVLAFSFRESHRPISLAEVSAVASLSPPAFCKYFKTRTRKTYISFLNELRVNNAGKLLLQGQKTVVAISYETGFNNLSHFNRVFKTITGVAPGRYRMQQIING
jgi:AraC-like DNA-binding protein